MIWSDQKIGTHKCSTGIVKGLTDNHKMKPTSSRRRIVWAIKWRNENNSITIWEFLSYYNALARRALLERPDTNIFSPDPADEKIPSTNLGTRPDEILSLPLHTERI